jgi:hypothetical protein
MERSCGEPGAPVDLMLASAREQIETIMSARLIRTRVALCGAVIARSR